jgi:hypothetical protein
MQIGGPLALLHFTYLDLFRTFTIGGTENSRYWMTFIGFYPLGLLLIYFGLAALKASKKYFRIWAICSICVVFATLFIGSRGTTTLFVIGWAYLRHQMVARLNLKILGALLAGLIVIIPWIALHRDKHDYGETAVSEVKFDPLAPLVEMGLTYRCLYAMIEVRADGAPSLNGLSYVEAIERLMPLSGINDPDAFTGTGLWLNRLADPVALANNGAMGSSGIGEPFVNFDYFGVVVFFVLLGWGFSAIECTFLNEGSIMAGAMLTLIIAPMGFYVRGDISGALRVCVWTWLLLFTVSKRASFAAMLSRGNETMIRNQ